jgi:uncharacterized protein
MVRIDLRAVHEGPVEIALCVEPTEPVVEQLECTLRDRIHLSGRIMDAGPGQYYWQGRIRTSVGAECRRCLATVDVGIDAPLSVLFTEAPNPEDPAAYGIQPGTTDLDLSDAVREELTLAVPEYVLCRQECRGLCPRCGTDLNTGNCTCQPEADSRWAALGELETAQPEHTGE